MVVTINYVDLTNRPLDVMTHTSREKIRITQKLRSHYPYRLQKSEVSTKDMKYPLYRCARTVDLVVVVVATGTGRYIPK